MGIRPINSIKIVRRSVGEISPIILADASSADTTQLGIILRYLNAEENILEKLGPETIAFDELRNGLEYAKEYPRTTAGINILSGRMAKANENISKFFKLNPNKFNSLFFRFSDRILELKMENYKYVSIFVKSLGVDSTTTGNYRFEVRWDGSKLHFFGPSDYLSPEDYEKSEQDLQKNFLLGTLLLEQLTDEEASISLFNKLKKYQVSHLKNAQLQYR